MGFLVRGSPIITDGRDLSAVGVATLTEDINIEKDIDNKEENKKKTKKNNNE